MAKTYKVQAVATLLGITVDTVRRDTEEAGIQVQRQGEGPRARLYSAENIFELAAFRARKHGLKPQRKLIITVYAPKGGVGKTTKTSNLMPLLSLMGLRVLGIDLDFQANLSLSFDYDPELTKDEAIELGIPADKVVNYHLGHLLPQWKEDGSVTPLKEVLKKPFGEHGPHLIPSEVTLDRLEAVFNLEAMTGKRSELAIAKFLKLGMAGTNPDIDLSQYDVIIFDAPPSKNPTTRAALIASDFVIAPVSMEKYSTKSVSYLAGVLNEMQADFGKFPNLVLVGNFFDTTRVRVAAQQMKLTAQYPDAWLERQVSTSEEFKKVLSSDESGIPLALARPSTQAAAELRAVAQALVTKMGILK